ncbi:hypothetical protein AALP_AA1G075100 [Arabis alpina]|uniref:Uncharacterized protein n=1 Tax=Arabis alpina TaxID=50452 RepID=A0A087HLS0_ARAAL|nr:hypothetical protein AALP_AA1G075100 [Arabis alpina]
MNLHGKASSLCGLCHSLLAVASTLLLGFRPWKEQVCIVITSSNSTSISVCVEIDGLKTLMLFVPIFFPFLPWVHTIGL